MQNKSIALAYKYNCGTYKANKDKIDDPQIRKLFDTYHAEDKAYTIFASISPNNKHIAYYTQQIRGYSDYETFIVKYDTLEPVCTIDHGAGPRQIRKWDGLQHGWINADQLYEWIDPQKVYPTDPWLMIYAHEELGWLNDDELIFKLEIPLYDSAESDAWWVGYNKLATYNVTNHELRNLTSWTVADDNKKEKMDSSEYQPCCYEIAEIKPENNDPKSIRQWHKETNNKDYLLHLISNNIANVNISLDDRLKYLQQLHDLTWQPRIPIEGAEEALFYGINSIFLCCEYSGLKLTEEQTTKLESIINPAVNRLPEQMISEIRTIQKLYQMEHDNALSLRQYFDEIEQDRIIRWNGYQKRQQQ